MCPSAYIYRGDIMDIDNMDIKEEPNWQCLQCNTLISREQKDIYIKSENEFLDTEFESLDHVLSLRNESLLHHSHYAIFYAIDNFTTQYFEIGEYDEALKGMKEIIAFLDKHSPGYHHEKVLYLDKLGQLAVRCDDHKLAVDAFRRAYEMSCCACGREAPITLKQKDMFENPPLSIADLLSRYPTIHDEQEKYSNTRADDDDWLG